MRGSEEATEEAMSGGKKMMYFHEIYTQNIATYEGCVFEFLQMNIFMF